MDAKTKKMLALAGAGILVYYFFVHKKKEETISEFSNLTGAQRRWCRDNWQSLPGSAGNSFADCKKRLREVS